MTDVDGSGETPGEEPRPGGDHTDIVEGAEPEDLERIRTVINELGRRVERLETTVADVEATVADVEATVADVEATVADVEATETGTNETTAERLDGVEAEFKEKVDDVRDRLVRVYRDVERKAPKEHTHAELEDHGTTLADHERILEELEAIIEEHGTTIEEFRTALDGIEESVETIEADHEDVQEKLSRVASAVVRTQKRLKPVERHVAQRRRLSELTSVANAKGINKATCEDCGETVRLTLLSTPECPHCESRFRDLEPNGGFFGTSTLLVGDPPALTGDVDEARKMDDSISGEGSDR